MSCFRWAGGWLHDSWLSPRESEGYVMVIFHSTSSILKLWSVWFFLNHVIEASAKTVSNCSKMSYILFPICGRMHKTTYKPCSGHRVIGCNDNRVRVGYEVREDKLISFYVKYWNLSWACRFNYLMRPPVLSIALMCSRWGVHLGSRPAYASLPAPRAFAVSSGEPRLHHAIDHSLLQVGRDRNLIPSLRWH